MADPRPQRPPPPQGPNALLDPATLARAEALGILAREVVEGTIVGEHRSPFQGFALEFAQHREYAPGDDLRHLDWKVLARSERYTVKQYEQDTNFVANLLVDGSGSMAYGSDGATSKFDAARRLAACLAYIILLQRDAAAIQVFDTEVRLRLPRTDALGRLRDLLVRLAALQPGNGTRLAGALRDLAHGTRRRGLVFILSDFFEDEEAILAAIRHLRFARQEVIVFHVLDPQELRFDFSGPVRFEGLEGEAPLETRPADLRKSYLAEFDAFRSRIRSGCERQDCHYVLVDTSRPLREVLGTYLAFRRRLLAR